LEEASVPPKDKSTTENFEDDGFIYEDNDAVESEFLFKQNIVMGEPFSEDQKTMDMINPVVIDTN
jgi:hypothetical protein